MTLPLSVFARAPSATVYSGIMAVRRGLQIREVVDWRAGDRRRQRLEAELERIVPALPGLGVRRAILFGSLARGDVGGHSDLDLIFIVHTQERFPERCRRFYEALEPRVGIDIVVYTPDEFEAVRHGHFLRRSVTAKSSMKPEAGSEGRRGLAQAENDLAFAELASRETFFAHACFHSQQAAEKALNAFLYARGAEQVLGYSVADLAVECAKLDGAFMPLTPRAAPLDQFYLPTRYPNTLPGGLPAHAFARPDAERALEMAREVIAVVKRRLG